jgi:hypothetical protein
MEIEVEFQTDLTIGLFSLEIANGIFKLLSKETNCLAKDHCGIPELQMPISNNACCSDSGCC